MEKDCHGRPAAKAGADVPKDALARLAQARASAAADGTLRHEEIPLTYEGRSFRGRMCWCEGAGSRPLVLVVHNYAGLKRFDEEQAAYVARCGFAALAVDMYGDDTSDPATRVKTAANAAQHYAVAFGAMNHTLRDHFLLRGLLAAWLAAGRAHPSVEAAGRAAACGYCYGGMAMFEMVRMGLDVDAVVSFHGVLQSDPIALPTDDPAAFDGVPPRAPPATYARAGHTRVLVANGDADTYVTPVSAAAWKAEMDGAGVDWFWHDYARTPHGFALAPDICTEYTEAADRRSTQAMWALLAEVWPDVAQSPVPLNACGTPINAPRACRQ